MLIKLNEDSRSQLLSKARQGANYKIDQSKGRNRYERRTKSKISNSVREYNQLDMNKFFKEDILDLYIKVHGETDDYMVGISFSGILELIREETERDENLQIDLRLILKMLKRAFNKDDHVLVRCSCPDFHYRFGYWASVNDLIFTNPKGAQFNLPRTSEKTDFSSKETRPSDITNPRNDLGPACKHVILVLSNTSWLVKLASAINNYIHYIEDHYEKSYVDIIYPMLYGDRPVQGALFGKDELDNTLSNEPEENEIIAANDYGRTRTQFKKGNQSGVQFAKNEPEDTGDEQMTLDLG